MISVDRLSDRKETTISHLKEHGIVPVVMDGLDGQLITLSKTTVPRGYGPLDAKLIYKMSGCELCLGINHWCLWKHIAMSGIPNAIIFEDDVRLPDNFMDMFNEEMENVPEGWDMVNLGILYPERFSDGRCEVTHIKGKVWRFHKPNKWDGCLDGLHAYLLSASGAEKLAGMKFELHESIDRYLSFTVYLKMNVYALRYSGVVQSDVTTMKRQYRFNGSAC